MIIIFDWLGDIISGMGDAIGNAFTGISDSIIDAILNRFIQWLFKSIYDGIANFFTQISNMGTEIFDLSWVQAVVKLFSLFGWSLFVVGVVVSAFDLAIEYQTGRANIKTTALNWIKGFMAVSLFTIVSSFNPGGAMITAGLFELVTLIALGFCVFKIFFDNIKRGGILLIQLAVGSLYMFSIPRGYGDGFNNWVKQVFALCLTAFLQTTLLFLGLLSWSTNMLLAIGIMMSAAEVPRIAQQFGLDTSVKVNVMSAVHMGTSAVNLVKAVGK